ncbi:MAG: signal peptide peptidase SppA [Deltaproteobacteria bacterium]|nr:signal peptide peptidase SppA [Deltaproteobacteria bacterium]
MRKVVIGILIAAGLVFIAFSAGTCAAVFKIRPFAKGRVGVVRVDGMITLADQAVENLETARKDATVKAVVLRIDSPGGAVGASQEIYEEVKKVDAEKPVIVSMGDVAASGGYYIACGGRKIFANLGTITGSIGVKMEYVNVKELLSWAKVEHQTLKSGKLKDVGAYDRDMTEEERKLLQDLLANIHAQFKKAVALERNLSEDEIEKIADGRVYTGEQAKELGLIDEIGGLTVAVDEAAKSAGIRGEPEVKEIGDYEPWWLNLITEKINMLTGNITGKRAVYKF